ncbi:hypothetical protein LTR42_005749 [Elasticomyces elasticus]|nr:hypothetical protein LTR42_005749 [Elasticomyces elasticus]
MESLDDYSGQGHPNGFAAVLASGQMRPDPPSFPHISCHEFAGTIVSLSANPSGIAKNYRVGQKVGAPGKSDHAGYSVFCSKANNNGINRNGGFSEYAVVDARQVALLPEEISPVDAAPLMCAGITIFGALKRCKLERGQRVGIVGAGGGLGHLGLQFATAMGLRTVGVDAADAPLQLARNLKTESQIVDARTEKAEIIVQRIGEEDGESESANMGLDAVIILPEGQSVGIPRSRPIRHSLTSQKGFDYGMKLLKNHGICVVVSFPEAGFHVSARDLVFRDITVTGSLVSSNKTLHEMLGFAAKHNVKAVSKTFPLDNLNGLVEEYNKAAGGKLVVDMSL